MGQQRLQQLMTSESPDAGVLVSPEGLVAHWNQGAADTFGYSLEEARGLPLSDLIVPSGHEEENAQRTRAVLANGSATYEAMRKRKDGSLLYVDGTCKRVADGAQDTLLLLVEKDVTQIKVLRDAKLMETRFRELLESTPDGIVMANPTGHIVLANSQAEKLFGYEAGELRGQSVDRLLPPRYRHAHVGHRSNYFVRPRKRAMGSGLDLSGLRKDGTEFPVEVSLSPLHTEESAFVLSAIRDISERKNFEKALQEKNMELARANQAKDRFLASMSHELRTPLNAIIGFTGTLLMRLPGPLTADQEKQLRTVQGSGRHLLALINDLLDVAKIEAGQLDLREEIIDCRALVEEVANTLRPQAEGKGLAFELALGDGPLHCAGDRRAISQIVINLVGNAVKFTQKGSVRIVVSQDCDVSGGKSTQVCVEDTGEGISEEDRQQLFGAFARGARARTSGTEGTGLGLHLSQKLARLLGGDIMVQSTLGQGSRFTLVLKEN